MYSRLTATASTGHAIRDHRREALAGKLGAVRRDATGEVLVPRARAGGVEVGDGDDERHKAKSSSVNAARLPAVNLAAQI